MPVYKVSVTLETVVYAEDEGDARWVAREGLEAALSDEYPHVDPVEGPKDLPPEWTMDALVWHDGSEDITVAEALKLSKEESP